MPETRAVIHETGDSVAVAIEDLTSGADVIILELGDGESVTTITANDDIPLGHKIALTSSSAGDQVIEYTVSVGHATAGIEPGDHVHTHNVRSNRWQMQ